MRCIVYILKQVRFSYLSLFSLFLIDHRRRLPVVWPARPERRRADARWGRRRLLPEQPLNSVPVVAAVGLKGWQNGPSAGLRD